jgi:hypothetical protein
VGHSHFYPNCTLPGKNFVLIISGYEEDAAADHYYANESYDDGYSPSPPRASGGAYYPETNQFPPPPVAPQAAFPQQPVMNPIPPIDPNPQYPPYNPAAYVGPDHPMDPYGNPAPRDVRDGGHVSSPTPYVPLTPQPLPTQLRNLHTNEEGASRNVTSHQSQAHLYETPADMATTTDRVNSPRAISPLSPVSSLSNSPKPRSPESPESPHNKSVTFAPLSPTSTRTLQNKNLKQRRNSDITSDRPLSPTLHRRRHRNPSRSPSPASSDEVEVLPDRFDRDGRPIDKRGGGGLEGEMVEKMVHDFEDVLDGRKSWKGLLKGFFDEAESAGHGRRR